MEFLSHFIELSSYDVAVRVEATRVILTAVGKAEAKSGDEHSETMIYTISRLVKGLSSSHDCARQGYLLCLTQLLMRFESVDPMTIVETAAKEAAMTVVTRQTARDALFRRLGGPALAHVVTTLLELARKRAFMEAACQLLMADVLSACARRRRAELTGLLNPHFSELTPDETRPLDVALLCLCAAHHVRVTPPAFLTPLFSDTTYPILLRCCGLACTHAAAPPAPFLAALLQYARAEHALAALTANVLAPLAASAAYLPPLLAALLPVATTATEDELAALLTPDLLKPLVLVLSDKHAPTRPAVADFLRQLATATEHASAVARALYGDGGSVYIDHIAGVSLTGLLAKKMTADEVDRLFRSTAALLVEGGHRRWLLEMVVALVTAPPCSDATFSEALTLLFAVGYGTAHPLLPKDFPTVVDARQRFLQLVLFTRTGDYSAEILAHLQTAYAFHSALVKPKKEFVATLKRCGEHVHFAVLLRFLSFEVADGPDAEDVLRDATQAISTLLTAPDDGEAQAVLTEVLVSLLSRGESQVRAIVKLVWMRLAPHIGEAIEIVTTAMVKAEENLVFTSDDESESEEKDDAPKDDAMSEDAGDDAGEDEDAPASLNEMAEEPELVDAEGIAALQKEIADRRRKKRSDRKQEAEAERRVVQFQLRLAALLETWVKAVDGAPAFLEHLPRLLQVCRAFSTRTRYAVTFAHLLELLGKTAKQAPLIKDVSGAALAESFEATKEFLYKPKLATIGRRLITYYVRYVQHGTPELAAAITAFVVQQTRRLFARKKGPSFKWLAEVVQTTPALVTQDMVHQLVLGGMTTSDLFLRHQALTLAHSLLQRSCNGVSAFDLLPLYEENGAAWLQALVAECGRHPHVIKGLAIMILVLRSARDTAPERLARFAPLRTTVEAGLQSVAPKNHVFLRGLQELKQLLSRPN